MKKALGLSKGKKKKDAEPAPAVSSSLEPRRGQEFKSLDEFEILETLGTGTFGRVRLVKHKATGKFYALKALKKSEVIRLKQVEHIRSEKDILSRIDHSFIVHLFATFGASIHTQFRGYFSAEVNNVLGGSYQFKHLVISSRL